MKNALKFWSIVAVLVSLPMTISFARADDSARGMVLRLTTESWLQAQSSEVHLEISMAPEQFEDPQTELMQALNKVDSTTDWHITSFFQPQDQTGLSRWQVSTRARMAVSRLAGLQQVLDSLNKPGLKIQVGYINQQASMEEREALMAQLREELYRKARDEKDRVNALNLGSEYEIRSVLFHNAMDGPMMTKMARHNFAAADAPRALSVQAESGGPGAEGGNGFFPISRKYDLSATVILVPKGTNQ